MKKLVIIQTTAPAYRKNFFQFLQEDLGDAFELYAGNNYFEASVKTDEQIPHKKIKNHYFFKRKFLFQTGIRHLLFSKAVIVMEMNPRIINNWIFLIIRKIRGKKTVLWGHAWPRKGKNTSSDILRNWMRKLSDEIIVYTRQQQKELQEKMPQKTIKVAPNALYPASMLQAASTDNNMENLIYAGRITSKKKVYFLVKAFHSALQYLPSSATLIIVGDGEEFNKINKYVQKHKLQNRIRLKGEIFDYQKLKNLYAQSIFSISPGYIGLSVTQSLGFGVPMLVSRNENHSPEIEAVVEGENALFFETDNQDDLVKKLIEIHKEKEKWIAKREVISVFCRKNYSVEVMAKAFLNLI